MKEWIYLVFLLLHVLILMFALYLYDTSVVVVCIFLLIQLLCLLQLILQVHF